VLNSRLNRFSIRLPGDPRRKQLSIGAFVRDLRKSRRLTLAQAGERAGVSFVTLSRWETGQFQPRLPELDSLLSALGVTSAQRTQALSLIDAPRAVAQLREEAQERLPDLVEIAGHAPAIGDLLRAMRLRRRLGLEQVAASLRVHPTTVRRWEGSEVAVPEERLPELGQLLGAEEEERQALAARRLHLWMPGGAGRPSRDVLEVQIGRLRDAIRGGQHLLLDLRLMTLEAQLWPMAARDPRARLLLARVYALHGEALDIWGRQAEIRSYATRTLDMAAAERAPDLETLYHGAHSAAASLSPGPPGRAYERRVGYMRRWLTYFDAPLFQTGIYRDMAEWFCHDGHFDEALACITKATVTAERAESAIDLRSARHIHAHILLNIGCPAQALPLLCRDEHPSPFQRLFEGYHWVDALLGVGERSAACEWLARVYAIVQRYDLPSEGADTLARKF
jgi:transcriptional regulator with XRE-family HTH domain